MIGICYDASYDRIGALPHRMDDNGSRAGSHAADSREPADRGAEKATAELCGNESICDAAYARAAATFGEQSVIDIVGISGPLLAAGDGLQYDTNPGSGPTHADTGAISEIGPHR